MKNKIKDVIKVKKSPKLVKVLKEKIEKAGKTEEPEITSPALERVKRHEGDYRKAARRPLTVPPPPPKEREYYYEVYRSNASMVGFINQDDGFNEVNKHLKIRYRVACHDDICNQNVIYYSIDYPDISRTIRKEDIEKSPGYMMKIVMNAIKGITDDINKKRELEAEEKYLADWRNYSYPNYMASVSGTLNRLEGLEGLPTMISGEVTHIDVTRMGDSESKYIKYTRCTGPK